MTDDAPVLLVAGGTVLAIVLIATILVARSLLRRRRRLRHRRLQVAISEGDVISPPTYTPLDVPQMWAPETDRADSAREPEIAVASAHQSAADHHADGPLPPGDAAPPSRYVPVEMAELWEPATTDVPPPGYVPLEMPELWEPAATEVPPPGYVPLEMPELWAPPLPSGSQSPSQPVPPQRHVTQPQFPVRAPTGHPLARPLMSATAPPPAPTQQPTPPRPRALADLRTGPLADRVFATPRQFAVAAVREGGYDVATIARLFRVPRWRLEEWLRDASNGRAS